MSELPSSVTQHTDQLPSLSVCNRLARARIYLHGAQIVSFRPIGESEVLWTSVRSTYAPKKAIRGGVPLCFPWFGAHAQRSELPAHGFARLSEWSLREASDLPDGRTRVVLGLASSPETLAAWPHEFSLTHTITVGSELDLALEVHNPGATPFAFEAALHTYLDVADVRKTTLEGLGGASYLDQVSGGVTRIEADTVRFTEETDRTFYDTQATCTVTDPILARRIIVSKQGSNTTVIWNPWPAKAARMSDFGDHEWPGMLCVEAANTADQRVTLAPSGKHVMRQTLRVLR